MAKDLLALVEWAERNSITAWRSRLAGAVGVIGGPQELLTVLRE